MVDLAELLERRRPRRVDARRNFDALLAAAAEAYTQDGPDVPMEEIARRAGVGVATLYRNFPTRVDLMECVYLRLVDGLVRFGESIDEPDPWIALVVWLRRFVEDLATKQVLGTVLPLESEAYRSSRTALYAFAEPLFQRAQRAGSVRADVDVDDVLRVVFAVTAGVYRDDAQRARAVQMILDGIRPAP
ncbi:TetR family transcriptional regulator [Sphaerisporangium melleum]|uniref:TetR family transcriptional regulator n=1 Tax=Sphaerisporangium melleum TaxID=321316 RepID=A0A917QUN6_9ACTN|nr:TetR/AcrR family transcriptional regulator [Sphaerisporangium melleum]GGK68538.1 TetR family transcriptional regulator [Sphaerisporangium melleum]GII68899.1 TetR family transcriptional regulator [Sphaerisporangium melleum]